MSAVAVAYRSVRVWDEKEAEGISEVGSRSMTTSCRSLLWMESVKELEAERVEECSATSRNARKLRMCDVVPWSVFITASSSHVVHLMWLSLHTLYTRLLYASSTIRKDTFPHPGGPYRMHKQLPRSWSTHS